MGDSCYPISPLNKIDDFVVSNKDQMKIIINNMPFKNKEADLSFLAGEDENMYINNLQSALEDSKSQEPLGLK